MDLSFVYRSETFIFVAALSVATERVTTMIVGAPAISDFLFAKAVGIQERVRVLCIQMLTFVVATSLCYFCARLLPNGTNPTLGLYLFFGLLASGGSSFWNSTMERLRGEKVKAFQSVFGGSAKE